MVKQLKMSNNQNCQTIKMVEQSNGRTIKNGQTIKNDVINNNVNLVKYFVFMK